MNLKLKANPRLGLSIPEGFRRPGGCVLRTSIVNLADKWFITE